MGKQIIHFQIFKGKNKKWFWHSWRSGKITADCGYGYTRRAAARRAAMAFVTSIEIGKYVIEYK